jgi:hypothetical protein
MATFTALTAGELLSTLSSHAMLVATLGGRFFRADAAYTIPALYRRLEEASCFYAIQFPANNVLREKIAQRLTRTVG